MESFTLKNGGKMNTYYLKKFRNEAWKKYAVQKQGNVYGVINRQSGFLYQAYETLESAIDYMHETRRGCILGLVREERNKRALQLNSKINKQLAKL